MDDLQFRRSIYADPKSTDPEVVSAKQNDPAKQKFAQEIDELDSEIFKALNVPVPEGLSQKLILRQSLASHQQQKRKSRIRLALAASITFAIGLTVNQLQFSHAYNSVGDYAIAHVNHEAHYFDNNDEADVTLTSLNKKMTSFNASFSDKLGDLMMADFCRFDGMKSLHLVYRGKTSPVNVFIVPHNDHLKMSKKFNDPNFNGVVTSHGNGHVIIVGDKQESLSEWQQKLDSGIRWST